MASFTFSAISPGQATQAAKAAGNKKAAICHRLIEIPKAKRAKVPTYRLTSPVSRDTLKGQNKLVMRDFRFLFFVYGYVYVYERPKVAGCCFRKED